MCIEAQTSHLFSPAWCDTLQKAIQEGIQDQLRVSLEVQYIPKNQEDIWEDAWDMALDTERPLHPMLVSILSSPKRSSCRAGQVEIKLPASQVRLLRHSGILPRLEADMRQITGSNAQIHLQEEAETPDRMRQQEEERKKREESILRKMWIQNAAASEEQMGLQSQAMVEPGELPWDDPADSWGSGMSEMEESEEEETQGDQILLGRRITGKIGELDPLEDKKRYVLHGIVSAKSEREIKGEKTLLQLTLTDYQKEAIVKAFVSNEDYEKWGEKIANGVTLMVKGTA